MIFIAGLLLLVGTDTADAKTYYCRYSGNWNSGSTWSTRSGGGKANNYPKAGDDAIIERGWTVTVTTGSNCTSLTIGNDTGDGTLAFSNASLTVSGTIQLGTDSWSSSGAGVINLTNGSSLTAGSLVLGTYSSWSNYEVNLATGSTLTMNGPITVEGYDVTWTPNLGTVVFNADNTLPEGITNFGNLTITAGTTTSSTGISVAGNLTINEGATFVSPSGTLNLAGNFVNNATFTNNSGTVYLNGSSSQTIGGTSPSVFNNLELNNTNGASLSANQTVSGTLTLTSGLLSLGNNDLTLDAASQAVAGTPGTGNMIVTNGTGQLKKVFSGNGSYLFPVGDITGSAEYTPLTLNFTSGAYSDGFAGVKVTNAK
ncbi:MAG: hypothetical protein Q8914_12275, partial [Bacteroidota bacterium]|nr:hypothetical protein [Bacteroidota bacterium]